MAIDFQAEGLLDGVQGEEARAARVELLEQLAAEGFTVEQLREAVGRGRLALLPVERILEGGPLRYTAAELSEQSGLPLEELEAAWRALGVALPAEDEKAFSDADRDAARRIRAAREAGLSREAHLEVVRVMSRGMANVAAAVMAEFGQAFLEPGDTERDLGRRYAEAARRLQPLMSAALDHIVRIHLREQVRQATVGGEELESGHLPGSQTITVCFADLVGFTRLGERLPPEELGTLAGRLEEMAADVASPPVRLVKTLGDAAMLVAPDPGPVIDTALELVEAAEREEMGFPPLHAGLALGPALSRAGDWYGRPVNLASRITAVARPGSVLVSEGVWEGAEGCYRWSFAGKRRLKGIKGEVALYRVRRPPSEES